MGREKWEQRGNRVNRDTAGSGLIWRAVLGTKELEADRNGKILHPFIFAVLSGSSGIVLKSWACSKN
jgi:hypothetical protein